MSGYGRKSVRARSAWTWTIQQKWEVGWEQTGLVKHIGRHLRCLA